MTRPPVSEGPGLSKGIVQPQSIRSRLRAVADPYGDRTIVSGSEPPSPESLDAHRRARVAAADLFLIITLTTLLGWRIATVGGELLLVQGGLILVLGFALVVLWSRIPLSGQRVRMFELGIFGLTALYLCARQYQLTMAWTESGTEAELVGAVKTTLIGTILLAFAYAMLIPNTWKDAARVIIAIVALPVATELLLLYSNPAAFEIARKYVSWHRVIEDALHMLIAAGLSIYGTHVITTLRSEAFEAKELNQYKLGERLGEGGMGEVYLAEHRLMKRPCAMKIIRPDTAKDPAALTRFEREVRATALLSHPNTVEVYDYGRSDSGSFYYVMEYLRGLSLDELVKKHGPMPPGRVIHLLRQVCGALAEAHAAGLIHRDVKPANIFACYRGGRYDVAKLLDFGLVKLEGPEPSTEYTAMVPHSERRVRGTPHYMAPEQIMGVLGLDQRCDLYSLGSVAYLLLTGYPPFAGNDGALVMAAQVRDPVLPPRRIRPEIPEDLEQVVLRCLAKQPGGRYPDAESLSQALAECKSAGEWDDAKAALWWHEFEPNATAEPG